MNTFITETTEHGDIVVDVYTKLANNRVLFISAIDDAAASNIVASLIVLDGESSEEKISLFINSYGCDIRNALMIYDTIKLLKSPIETICVGNIASEAVILLCAGTPGMRIATKNSVISVSPLIIEGSLIGNLTDAQKQLNLQLRDNNSLMEILAAATNKPLKTILKDFPNNRFFSAAEAKAYGLIDKIANIKKDK